MSPEPTRSQGSLFGGIEDEVLKPKKPAKADLPRYEGPMVTVAPEVPVPRLFTYALPPHLVGQAPVGVRVKVPFHGRSVRGFVVEIPDEAPPGKLKEVQSVIDAAPVLRPDVLRLARWAADYYRSALGEVLAAAVPKSVGGAPRSRDKRGWLTLTHGPWPKRLGPSQLGALDALAAGPQTWSTLREAGIKSDVLRRLEKAGLIAEAEGADGRSDAAALELTGEQTLVLGPILRAVAESQAQTTLLFGVTGSGKTEIYLRAIARALEQGKGAIVLVPEISLTPQTLARFRARFGDTVAILHSQLSGFDRRKEWWRVHQNEARVVIGPRSAVWAPVENLGLIVVDEEHEGTYKQESNPRYHARDLSVVRGQQLGIPIILGSATPSLESWQNASRGRYRLARMRQRPGGAKLPQVRVVDMGREWSEIKRAALLSRRLVDSIKSTLARGERVLLFQNRRGYTTYLQCKACGFVLKCRTCDVSLTYHRKEDVCVCHFCDAHVKPSKDNCPDCMGPPLSQRGAGTERIEQIASELFPQARIGRLDTDIVRGGQSAEEVLQRFATGELNLLVGTQIIAKGLHIPEVTCVGVISADSSLALPDFRSSERTFQLIAQVAGRSGRGERAGTTIVQTFSPRHFSVRAAADHDYEAFAKDELVARESLAYPPFARLLKVLVRGPIEEQVEAAADVLGDALRALPAGTLTGVLGPVPSPRAYLSNKFRFQLLVKGNPTAIRAALACVEATKVGKGGEVVVDVDPYHLL